MSKLALLALLSPALAFASDCEHAQPRSLDLDLSGVSTVRIEVNSHELRLGPARDGQASFTARACASDPAFFEQLTLTQERQGDVLVVRAERDGYSSGLFFKPTYAYLQLDAQLPATLAYEVRVGSGEASISGQPNLRLDVGSGEAVARGATGTVVAKVGSGEASVYDAGTLDLISVGSGDFEARGVRNDATVGDIGSGDVALHTVKGNVRVDSIGSGDLLVTGVDGSVAIGSIGSGDADVTDVGEGLSVRRVGSGDVNHRDVRGTVDVPSDD
ncbi:MAG: hypothetical protein NT046_07990 [Arenimonas sp.]|nr:hypothetical protein [Arenimonas sp.]